MNAFTFRRLKEKGAPRRRWGSRGQSWEDEEEESQMGRQRGFFRGERTLWSLWELSVVCTVSLPRGTGLRDMAGDPGNTQRK